MHRYRINRDFLFCCLVLIVSFSYFYSSINSLYWADDPIWIYNGKKILATHKLSSFPFYYRLIPAAAFAVEYCFFGANYLPYHIFQVILFVATSCLFYFLSKLILKNILASFITTLLFVLNPLNFCKVNWIAAQNYSWLGIFYLSTTLAFITYLKKNKFLYFFIFNLLFFASLWSHELGTTLIILLPYIYVMHIFEQKNKLILKNFMRTFSIIFVLIVIYLSKIYPLYFNRPIVVSDFHLTTVTNFFSFLTWRLSYIIYLVPFGKILHSFGILRVLNVFLIAVFLFKSKARLKLFILWIIITVLPYYFSPQEINDWSGDHIFLSSFGVFMIYGYLIDRGLSFITIMRSRAVKRCVSVTLALLIICTASYYLHISKDFRSARQGDKYSYYFNIVKSRFPQIEDNFEIYFVDGSPFVNFTKKWDNFLCPECVGESADFEYFTFIYALKLSYNIRNISGFAISPSDVEKIANRPNSVVLKIVN